MGGESRWEELSLGLSGFLVILFSLRLSSFAEITMLFLIKPPFGVSRNGINYLVCMSVYTGKFKYNFKNFRKGLLLMISEAQETLVSLG